MLYIRETVYNRFAITYHARVKSQNKDILLLIQYLVNF